MFIQTQKTPNPNSLKFIPGKLVSKIGSLEISNKDATDNNLLKNILEVDGVNSIFLDQHFLTVNKKEDKKYDIKHIIALLNEHYGEGKEIIIDQKFLRNKTNYKEVENR